jgi:phenylpropionate dioxygenase-like ring-hydroxylating dioxygenase large terminal subunit
MAISDVMELSLDQLLADRRPGWSLPRKLYVDPNIFEVEMEKLFDQQWLFTDHTSRIPNVGDYFLFKIGNESIVVIRARDGQVHAFFNVCRHRGSRICLEQSGTVKKLMCPYHNWAYELDGSLITARHMPADFDKTQFGLHRCEVRVLEGLIFVSLGTSAPPFDRMAYDTRPYWEPYELPHTRIAHRMRCAVRANWKLVLENFVECYHCVHAHPEFTSVFVLVAGRDSKPIAERYQRFTTQ